MLLAACLLSVLSSSSAAWPHDRLAVLCRSICCSILMTSQSLSVMSSPYMRAWVRCELNLLQSTGLSILEGACAAHNHCHVGLHMLLSSSLADLRHHLLLYTCSTKGMSEKAEMKWRCR